jgi:rsbT co-antagonist protein RsbR
MMRLRNEQQQIREAVQVAMVERERQAIEMQAMIHELSTPIVPVYAGILIVPLVGTIDARRSDKITDRLLDNISRQHATVVIMDITGVPLVDTNVAQHLLQTAQAANLLGAKVLLVGINPEIAQTMVQLGVNMGKLVTLSNLEEGLAYALKQRGLGILPLYQHAT